MRKTLDLDPALASVLDADSVRGALLRLMVSDPFHDYAANTARTYRTAVTHFLAWWTQPSHHQAYSKDLFTSYCTSLQTSTVTRSSFPIYFTGLRKFFDQAVAHGIVPHNYAVEIKVKAPGKAHRRGYPSPQHIHQLLQEAFPI